MRVGVFINDRNPRSVTVGRAMARGLSRHGHEAVRETDGEAAVFYGCSQDHVLRMRRMRETGRHFVLIDLGYWRRGRAQSSDAYYKVSIDHWHPTAYVRRVQRSPDRARQIGVQVYPERKGLRGVLLAGMGPKGCRLYEMADQAWDVEAVARIRSVTDEPIYYRPKPSWRSAPRIEGTILSSPDEGIVTALRRVRAVVTHHSNVAVDAIVDGIPAIAEDGAASTFCKNRPEDVSGDLSIAGRENFIYNLAWCQWSVSEMASGQCWGYVEEEIASWDQ